MSESRWAVLIRGINVGGNNLVPMPALREALTAAGASAVGTYIQSGNVVLTAPGETHDVDDLVEGVLSQGFGVNTFVLSLNAAQLDGVVANAPALFTDADDAFKCDVVFLKDGLESEELLPRIKVRDGVDQAWAGPGCLYFSRRTQTLTQSHLKFIMTMPEYGRMTIRTWRTVLAVQKLLKG